MAKAVIDEMRGVHPDIRFHIKGKTIGPECTIGPGERRERRLACLRCGCMI